ncbi:MAG: DUF2599 domain-containing protein [Paucimonas sp.]|jgi:hypothetical protein|nr:DUF2599 domain-containing protein [Paucimonas sp.]
MNRRIDGWRLLVTLPLLAQVALANAETCESAVQRLEKRYNDTSDYCVGANGERQAAHFCNGLTMRGVRRPEDNGGKAGDFFVFDTPPNSLASGASAATYARADIKFRDPVVMGGDDWPTYGIGMVVKPAWETENSADKVYLDCAIPADAWAYDRADKGCGDNSKTPRNEGRCADEQVNGDNWTDKFFNPNLNRPEYIGGESCAFDMRTENSAESSQAFAEFLKARRAMEAQPNQRVAFNTYPEVRFSNPQSGIVPVDAFYYTTSENRAAALKNQAEYKQKTGRDVAVVQVRFPKNQNEKVTFSCDAKADPVPPAEPAPGAKAGEVAAGGWGTGGDPKQCSKYFEDVVWIRRYDSYLGRWVDSVSVTPTDCGRQIGPDQTDKAFAELKQKALALPGGAEKWNNRDDTLRRQYVCHIALVVNGLPVRYKENYNLEPIRTNVSHEQSLADGCNTPRTDDGMIGGWGHEGSSQCKQYVSSVRWVARKFAEYGDQTIMSLEVIPTECGRKIGADQTDKMMAEIKQKALAEKRGAEFWGGRDRSMRLQTICLMKKHRDKREWNIEQLRPDNLTVEQYEAADCNPK